jgi:hypothetical protein
VKPVTIIAQAVGAWLQYEFACGRSTLFNERYISVPVANALHSIYKDQVRSEYLHPVLASAKTGPGRRPEVDFALVRNYPTISCVLETKWCGKNGLTAEDVLWDLLRLELIAHDSHAPAFFVLAGRRRHLETFFESKAFLGTKTADGKYRRLLKIDHRRGGNIRIDSPNLERGKILKRLFSDYQQVSFSSRVATSMPRIYPKECPTFQYQAYAWQVLTLPVPRFLPANNLAYRV